MATSFYLKYRPKRIEELDLTEVREAMGVIARSQKLSHAYLFDGPRGSGKTSSARILAKVANCENLKDGDICGKCEMCVAIQSGAASDVVEIDAASNRGIDDIRELRQRVGLAPARLKRKVYIIDEVHMLTTEAFNALLKTLEEPPPQVIFILCTTEPHKLPETIISRSTRIKYRKASAEETKRALARVVKGEKIRIDDQAIELLASKTDGSFRDAVKVLEQAAADSATRISAEMVERLMYGVSGFDGREFVTALAERDLVKAHRIVQEAVEAGMDMQYFLQTSMYLVRDSLLAEHGLGNEGDLHVPDAVRLIKMMDQTLRSLLSSSTPDLLVELLVLEWCGTGSSAGTDGEDEEEEEVEESSSDGQDQTAVSGTISGSSQGPGELWESVVKGLGKSYSLEALLSSARLEEVGDRGIVVSVAYEFHKEQLESERYRRILEEMVEKVYGRKLGISVVLAKNGEKLEGLRADGRDDMMSESSDEALVKAAEEIFAN